MDGKFNELELLFVEEVLDQHGEYITDLMTDEIDRKNIRDTDALMDSIKYRVTKYGIDPVLQVDFLSYGRALEIRYHKRSQNTQGWIPNTNKVVWGNGTRKAKKNKNVLFYTRNVYGSQNRLINILMYELTNEERARLRGIFEAREARKNKLKL